MPGFQSTRYFLFLSSGLQASTFDEAQVSGSQRVSCGSASRPSWRHWSKHRYGMRCSVHLVVVHSKTHPQLSHVATVKSLRSVLRTLIALPSRSTTQDMGLTISLPFMKHFQLMLLIE